MRFQTKIFKRVFVFIWFLILPLVFIQTTGFCEAKTPQYFKFGGLTEDEIISMDALRQKQINKEKFLLIDARDKKSYDTGHIEGATLSLTPDYYREEELFRKGIVQGLPDSGVALSQAMSRYAKDAPIITYCSDHCQASAVLLLKMKRLGFQNIHAMEGGFQSWQEKGYPVSKNSS